MMVFKPTIKLRSCARCGTPFKPYHTGKGKYCSVACVSPRLGEERMMQRGRRTELCVRVKVSKSYTADWLPKRVLIIEAVIGRKLRNGERVSPADGNWNNLSPDNWLVLGSRWKIYTCDCGYVSNLQPPSRHKAKFVCSKCFLRGLQNKRRTLTEHQASVVRSLARDGGPGVSWWQVDRWFGCAVSASYFVARGDFYKGIKPMAEQHVWKALLEQHGELVKKGNAVLYDRVTLLRRVFEDKHFQADVREEGKSPTEVLDGHVADTCANITELLQILKLFPRRDQWTKGNLGDMRAAMLRTIQDANRKPGKDGEAERKNDASRRLSWKEKYLKLEGEYKQLQASYRQLKKDHAELRGIVDKRLAS